MIQIMSNTEVSLYFIMQRRKIRRICLLYNRYVQKMFNGCLTAADCAEVVDFQRSCILPKSLVHLSLLNLIITCLLQSIYV